MTHNWFFLAAVLAAAGFGTLAGVARAEPMRAGPGDDVAARCKALGSTDFSSLPDAPTQIVHAEPIEAGEHTSGYCHLSGYVAPSVGFALRLPLRRWNGKLVELGCGNLCGSLQHLAECEQPLRRGYACIVSDSGHRGSGAKWAYNNLQAEMDFAYRATYVTAVAGKAIVERYYRQAPKRSYFMGCSAGGRDAVVAAQRFPREFDGIVAGAPALEWTGQMMDRLWDVRAMSDAAGRSRLDADDLALLHRAVLARCDRRDGVEDGLIGDPRVCDFDPAQLRCAAGQRNSCLTEEQVGAVAKIYSGPVNSRGVPLALPAALRGSEQEWGLFGAARDATAERFRYLLFHPDPGPSWQLEDFDFDRDDRRLGLAANILANHPDLRPFRAAGGKLLMYMQWNDLAAGGALRAVDYYETVERLIGDRARTQEFFRLFMIPGTGHCRGGSGASAVDWLSALELWVEHGQAPERLVGAHIDRDEEVTFTRPLYPYPTQARYLGRGDPKDATSFGPVAP